MNLIKTKAFDDLIKSEGQSLTINSFSRINESDLINNIVTYSYSNGQLQLCISLLERVSNVKQIEILFNDLISPQPKCGLIIKFTDQIELINGINRIIINNIDIKANLIEDSLNFLEGFGSNSTNIYSSDNSCISLESYETYKLLKQTTDNSDHYFDVYYNQFGIRQF